VVAVQVRDEHGGDLAGVEAVTVTLSSRAFGISGDTMVDMAMTLRLDGDETEALRRRAELEQRSMQEVPRQAIREYVENHSRADLLECVLDEELPVTPRRWSGSVSDLPGPCPVELAGGAVALGGVVLASSKARPPRPVTGSGGSGTAFPRAEPADGVRRAEGVEAMPVQKI
jgi:hypothetical protein